jgi:hypothetical protein
MSDSLLGSVLCGPLCLSKLLPFLTVRPLQTFSHAPQGIVAREASKRAATHRRRAASLLPLRRTRLWPGWLQIPTRQCEQRYSNLASADTLGSDRVGAQALLHLNLDPLYLLDMCPVESRCTNSLGLQRFAQPAFQTPCFPQHEIQCLLRGRL